MAYPTGMLAFVLESIDRTAASTKVNCQNVRNEAAAGNIPSSRILNLFIELRQNRVQLAAAAGTSGIGAYAQAAKNLPGLDVVAEFTAMLAAFDAVTAWINANFPKDGSGFLLAQTLGADSPVDRMFSPAQTAGFRTALDSLIATIT